MIIASNSKTNLTVAVDSAVVLNSMESIRRIAHKNFSLNESAHAQEEVNTLDALNELKSNIADLEEASLRLGFMLREVSYLVRKS